MFKFVCAAGALVASASCSLAGFINTSVTGQLSENPPTAVNAPQTATVGAGVEFANLGSFFSADVGDTTV